MAIVQFQPIQRQLSLSDINIGRVAGTTDVVAGDYFFKAIGANLAGINLASDEISVNLSTGDSIQFQVELGAIVGGEDLQRVYFVRSSDNFIVAAVEIKNTDRVTTVTLPANTVANRLDPGRLVNAFPLDPFNGEVVELSATNTETLPSGFYIFLESDWVAIDSPSLSVLATNREGGSDRPASLIENLIVELPRKTQTDSTAVKLCYLNGFDNTNSIVPQGTQIDLVISVNGSTEDDVGRTYNNLFSGLVFVRILGIYDYNTRLLDTSNSTATAPWTTQKTPIVTPVDLQPGTGLSFEVFFSFEPNQLRGRVERFAAIGIDAVDKKLSGTATELGFLIGDVVYPNSGRLRIVPNKRLGGVATIGGSSNRFFTTPELADEDIAGFSEDLANQQVAIAGNTGGAISILPPNQPLASNQALRAIVGTTPGFTQPIAFSSDTEITVVASNGSIVVDIDLGSTIANNAPVRSDYPDVVAGTFGVFNAPEIIFYFLNTSSNVITQTAALPVSNSQIKSFTISNIGIVVASLPTNTDNNFGLYSGEIINAQASNISGTVPVGTYQISYSWNYPSPNFEITSISHSEELGCIRELASTITDFSAIAEASNSTGSQLINTLNLL